MLSFLEAVFKKRVTALLVVLAMTLGGLGGIRASAGGRGTVVSDKLHVRTTPDKDGRSVMILRKGADFSVVGPTANGWLEIERNGLKGFVRNREIYIRLDGVAGAAPKKKKAVVEKELAERTREIRKIGSKIKVREGEIRAFSEKERAVVRELDGIDRNLSRARMNVAAIKKDLGRIEAAMVANTRERATLHESIRSNEDDMARRLISLYKLHHVGKMNVLASADSMYGMINRQRSLECILKEDERLLGAHLERMERLRQIETQLAEQKGKVEKLKKDAVIQAGGIERNRQRRSVLLSEIRNRKSAGLAALSSLKDAARGLDQTIRALGRGLAEKEAHRGNDEPMIITAFTARKGRLPMPVKGRIVKYFGKSTDREFKVETFESGIQVRADRGEPVQAVGAGEVLFSDWLKGYGNLIIIDHGNSYYSLYGHTEEVFKHKGDRVEDREVIATVGDTGSLSGPLLHFEIRHRGEPLDPLSWLKRGDG